MSQQLTLLKQRLEKLEGTISTLRWAMEAFVTAVRKGVILLTFVALSLLFLNLHTVSAQG